MKTYFNYTFFFVLWCLLPGYLVLAEQEGQQHQHASVVHDPPHVDVALGEALAVGREGRDVLGHQQSEASRGGFSDQLCRAERRTDE